jgi:predicted phage baseplate assembly protein
MSLPLPNLDDRRWADLVEEATALIPLYAPEWTDYNVSDPGITFTELFAWLAEMDIFELNQVLDRHRRKFLSLVGIVPEPPRPARATLRFVLKAGTSSLAIPAETEFEGNDPFGIVTEFRTRDSALVLPVMVQSLKFADSSGIHDLTTRWRQGQAITVFGGDPQPGAAFYAGLDASLPPGSCASFYLTFDGESAGDVAREHLLDLARRRHDCCHAPGSLLDCEPKPPPPPPPPSIPRHHCAWVA